jgi:gas vesicle protein
MSKSKSFFSILLGLAAGTAIGMLYAPDKGWKTRARIRRAAENGYEDLKEDLDNLGTKVDEKTAEARETIKDLSGKLKEKAGAIKEEARAKLEEQLARLEEALKQAEKAAEEAVDDTEAPAADEQ